MAKRNLADKDVDAFVSLALDFCGDGIWPQFLRYMEEMGYNEGEVERLTDLANKRAGRV